MSCQATQADALELFKGRRQSSSCAATQSRQNISAVERTASTLTGAGLVLGGLATDRSSRLWLLLAGGALLYRGLTGHCHGYQLLGFNTAERPPATAVPARTGFKYETTTAIQRDARDLYEFWRNLPNLPRVMRHLERVDENGDGHSHWVAQGALGQRVEWDAEIIQQRDNELIAWRSLPDSDVDTAGSVRFRSLGPGRGTAIDLSLKYNPPGGKAGALIAWLVGEGAEAQIDEDLRRFKSLMEAGEAPTVEGQPRGA